MIRFSQLLLVALTLLLIGSGAAWAQFSESPMLQERVDAGELPPVEMRLPAEPLVIEPYHTIGQYGGTWYSQQIHPDWLWSFRMTMYGHSPLRWVDDGLDIAPNWLHEWESNADATVWTLHMRPGIHWSDGEPFTGHDFMFWWHDMALNPEVSDPVPDMFTDAGVPAEIQLLDDFTIEIQFSQPSPLLAENLAMWINFDVETGGRLVVPAHYLKQYHPAHNPELESYESLEEMAQWWLYPGFPTLGEWLTVEHIPGQSLALERNPYYYAVDTEGNQLPYIDRREINYVSDMEVLKLRLIAGQADFHLRQELALRDLAVLTEGAESGGYELKFWDTGSGTGAMFLPNWNHPDEARRALYREPAFFRAISVALNRPRMRDMVYFGTGQLTTGTFSAKAVEYTRHPQGPQILTEWQNSYVEYDPDLAKEWLDQLGVADHDGNGWRDMPNGDPLTLRIDYWPEAGWEYLQINEMAKSDWEDIGLQAELNPITMEEMFMNMWAGNFDILNSWEVGDGPNHVVYPHWIVPVDNSRWAPLYGGWYQQAQLGTAHDQDDLPPYERMPPRKQPDPAGPVARLQALYDQIRFETDESVRDDLAMQMVRIHIDEGPFFLGTVSDVPRIVYHSVRMKNVPDREELGQGGFVNPWILPYPAIVNPAQFWLED